MSTTRIININLSKLDPTIRTNLSQLCVYLLGLKPSDKEDYFESAYSHFFGTKLYSALKVKFERNPQLKNFASKEVIDQIIEDLTHCIGAISDDEIIQTLKKQIADEAKTLNANPHIECLREYQNKAAECFKGTPVLESSEIAWEKTLACLNKEVYYRESLKYLNWGNLKLGIGFMVVLMLFQKFIFDYLNARAPENTKFLAHVSETQSEQQMKFMLLIFTATLASVAVNPIKIKVNFSAFDDVITTRFGQVIKDNLVKKSELEKRIKLADPTSNTTAASCESSEMTTPVEEDKPAPKKEKRKYQISYSAEPSVEEKNEVIPPKIRLNGSIFYLNQHPSGRCYTRYNENEMKEKIPRDRQRIVMPKIKSAIEGGRVDDPVRPGIVKVEETELKKFPDGWKLRIKENERFGYALRAPEEDENECGMEQVFSPRELKYH